MGDHGAGILFRAVRVLVVAIGGEDSELLVVDKNNLPVQGDLVFVVELGMDRVGFADGAEGLAVEGSGASIHHDFVAGGIQELAFAALDEASYARVARLARNPPSQIR